MSDINTPKDGTESEKKHGKFIVVFLGILFIIITLGLIFGGIQNIFNNNDNNKGATPFQKEEPSISVESSLTGLIFNIQCKDNYSYVIVKINLLDKNYDIVKTFTIRENDMKKGELRQSEYKFSVGEMFTTDYVRTSIEEYK